MSISSQPLLLNFLCIRDLGVAALDINNCGVTLFVAEKVTLLHHKIATPTQRNYVVTLHRLIKGEAIFGKFALRTPASLGKPSVGVAESVRFIA